LDAATSSADQITLIIQRLCAPLLVPISLLLPLLSSTGEQTTFGDGDDAKSDLSIKGFRRIWMCITAYGLVSSLTTTTAIMTALEVWSAHYFQT
jgi:hypothetical protein